MPGAG